MRSFSAFGRLSRLALLRRADLPRVRRRDLNDGRVPPPGLVVREVHLLLPLQLRVEGVTQAVPEEGEAGKRSGDAERREQDEVRFGADVLVAVVDQAAPRCAWRLDADADVGQRRLGEDRARGCPG